MCQVQCLVDRGQQLIERPLTVRCRRHRRQDRLRRLGARVVEVERDARLFGGRGDDLDPLVDQQSGHRLLRVQRAPVRNEKKKRQSPRIGNFGERRTRPDPGLAGDEGNLRHLQAGDRTAGGAGVKRHLAPTRERLAHP